ncbi:MULTISPECIES: PKD domain-containing protein [unclassified Nocardioides]|uniref:PKD domain-containing protein n=1 Tax=unclassified Nocardioides TaxID=2615069 RepID=UPI0009F106A3|nr:MULTISPECIES: PKD domain-containing protein [unclassified Nocardioides]GAW48077.1 PKD domain-containing protein [Nocardioides sp. PD653-B2]GAW53620.1 PKD domain-containing protein [Nocardioides sp. PD653]
MSQHAPSSRRRRTTAVTTALVAGLATATLALPATTASAASTAPTRAVAPRVATSAPAVSTVSVGGLQVENSFVSSVGWVKPGDTYPSRIIVSNTTDLPVAGASVVVTAPEGSTITGAGSGATISGGGTTVTWAVPAVGAKQTKTLVLESVADTTAQNPEIVWRDISTSAAITVGSATKTATSHGPKVIPPSDVYDTARYGDRPFPVVPVQYRDRAYQAGHNGDSLESVINDPAKPGSTYNLYQEMSLGQLFPEGTVPSAGIATKDFTYAPGFDFSQIEPGQSCAGLTETAGVPAPGTVGGPAYTDRITDGVYNLPGNTGYYGSDANGSAIIGSLAGVGALQNIDSGCGPAGKMVYDAAAIADPEIDYSDYDTDKDGVVDFFMAVFAGCGGNGSSQLSVAGCDYTDLPYDNVWPHSSSLEYYYSDPVTGLPGFTTDDQLKDLEGRPLWYTDDSYRDMTTTDKGDALKVFVRVGPYNVNPETAIDKASVISHEYGHSLGLPDFYSTGSRETYGDWNLMATDKSQNMDAFSRQELGWVVPQVLQPGQTTTVSGITDSKQDTGTITWQRPDGTPYTLTNGPDGTVHNSEMFVAKLPGRQLLDPAKFDTGDKASKTHAWWSGSGNDFGCSPNGGHNLDLSIPQLASLPAGSTVNLSFKSNWDIEWDYDYGYVLTTTDGGKTYTSHASENGYTTSNTDPLAGNPNQNTCQATYDNGLTGTSGSYQAGTEASDRKLGNTPDAVFLEDSYDISDLAGKANGALRFSYATDPGLARPGWFIDDVEVTATTPSGEKVLLQTDFESDGGPDDARIFNGGCREDLTTAQQCTQGWKYLQAGAESEQDHAYYLEMRDRSGFDLDGHGQIDRDPIGWAAGLYLAYTDEAHGYGNAGTDDPPAQSPLDSTPEPGSSTPDLNDAAFTAASGRSSYSDAASNPHVDNYADPSSASGNWEFGYGCLGFNVLSMSGADEGPATSDGDLTGNVKFTMGTGCGQFDYGYTKVTAPQNTAPTAQAKAPATATTGESVTFSGAGSTDAETPNDLDYSWDFGNGGSTKDAAGPTAHHAFNQPGTYDVTLLVTDPSGATDTDAVQVTVAGKPTGPGHQAKTVPCGASKVKKTGSWRNVKSKQAPRGSYCDNLGKGTGKDTMTFSFRGPRLDVMFGKGAKGGAAALIVDGHKVGMLKFHGKGKRPSITFHRKLSGLGAGKHTVTVAVTKGRAFLESFRA